MQRDHRNRPAGGSADTHEVDVLSDAIVAVRTGRPHSIRHELFARWGMHFPSGEGAGFHVVLRGSCWLIPAEGPPIALKADVVSTADGSDIRGTATAPVHGATPAFLALLLGGWVLLGVSGGIVTGTFVVVVGPLVAIAWTLIIRHNQRMALGHLDQLVETLESIVSEP